MTQFPESITAFRKENKSAWWRVNFLSHMKRVSLAICLSILVWPQLTLLWARRLDYSPPDASSNLNYLMVLWGQDASMLPCSTSREAKLTQQWCAGCPSAQGEPSLRQSCLISVPPLQGRMPTRFLRGSITALWDPTVVLCRGFTLHKMSSKTCDTKHSWPLSNTYSLSTAQYPRKSNLQAILTTMQSPGGTKNKDM